MTNEETVSMIRSGIDREKNLESLYFSNSGLIERAIAPFKGIAEADDLRQEAFICLMNAVNKWDENAGYSFSTYLFNVVRWEIMNRLAETGATVRLPRWMRQRILQYRRTVNSFVVRHGRKPSDEEIGYLLILSLEEVAGIKHAANMLQISSLDEIINTDDETVTRGDLVEDKEDKYSEALDALQNDELSEALDDALRRLPEQKARVIRLRYKEGRSLKECAAAMGVPSARIQQLEGYALRDIRTGKYSERLRAFLEDKAEQFAYHHGGFNDFINNEASAVERTILELEKYEKELTRREVGKPIYFATAKKFPPLC